MPNKHSKGKARLQKQAAVRRRQQERLKKEASHLREKLVAAIDNAVPISTWLPTMPVRLRKFIARLPRQKPRSKKETK